MSFHEESAREMYIKYQDVQRKISAIEKEALNAARGNARAAANILLNPAQETPQSFTYKNLCGDREQYMKRAQLDATMAIMLQLSQQHRES